MLLQLAGMLLILVGVDLLTQTNANVGPLVIAYAGTLLANHQFTRGTTMVEEG